MQNDILIIYIGYIYIDYIYIYIDFIHIYIFIAQYHLYSFKNITCIYYLRIQNVAKLFKKEKHHTDD